MAITKMQLDQIMNSDRLWVEYENEYKRYCDAIDAGDHSGNNNYNTEYNKVALAYAIKVNRLKSIELLLDFLSVPKDDLTIEQRISYYQLIGN